MENEFRRALEECLEAVRLGRSPEECAGAYPRFAERLLPLLRSAAALRGLAVPEPTVSSMQKARNALLERVVSGSGKEAAVVRGVFKLANVAGVAVAALFVAGMSLVAAAGPGGLFDGDGEEETHSEFRATVISVAPTLLYVQNTENGEFVFTVLSNQTEFQDAQGRSLARADIQPRARILVRATQSAHGPRFFDAHLIRLMGENPQATKAPTIEPTKEAESTPEPTPAPTPETTPAPTEKPEPTVMPTPKETPKPTEKPASQEFWGVVLGMSATSLTLQTEMGNVVVRVNNETQYPSGHPVIGAKVLVFGTKQGDGSWIGHRITVKTAEFSGQVSWISGSTIVVKVDGWEKAVQTNGSTAFPNGFPAPGDNVFVYAYKMGDGSYLAIEIGIKPPEPSVFTGMIVKHLPGEFIIKVKVDGVVKVVCYENGDVIGTLVEGATVEVHVDHVEGDTYFAGLVKVLG
jgi:hypothetical protein